MLLKIDAIRKTVNIEKSNVTRNTLQQFIQIYHLKNSNLLLLIIKHYNNLFKVF